MSNRQLSIPNVLGKPRWCALIDPTDDGPMKLCLGLSDCSRCGFAQWLDLMDAVPTIQGAESDIVFCHDPALAA